MVLLTWAQNFLSDAPNISCRVDLSLCSFHVLHGRCWILGTNQASLRLNFHLAVLAFIGHPRRQEGYAPDATPELCYHLWSQESLFNDKQHQVWIPTISFSSTTTSMTHSTMRPSKQHQTGGRFLNLVRHTSEKNLSSWCDGFPYLISY
jgi:hypothetical protein